MSNLNINFSYRLIKTFYLTSLESCDIMITKEKKGGEKMKKYRTKIGDRMSTVRCPFCGVINVYAAKYGQKEACSHRINEYCREYPDIMPENKYTRVFVFENEA